LLDIVVRLSKMKRDIILDIKVITNAKKNKVVGKRDGKLVIKLNALPIQGRANKKLVEFLAEFFNVRKSNITILKGAATHIKKVEVREVDIEKVVEIDE